MTDFIYSNIYYIFSVLIYLILAVFTLYKLSGRFRKFVKVNIFSKLSSFPVLIKVKNLFQKIFGIFDKLVNSEIKAGIILKRTENYVSEKLTPLLTEPVNILSLLIRKIFTDNIPVIITFTSFLLVAFYIILTVL